MRLFVAIELPEVVQQQLSLLHEELPGVRWVRPEQLHLTLAFLGELAEQQLGLLGKALEGVSFEPFTLRFEQLGCFPDQRHPRVVWIGLQSNPALQQLARQVQAAAMACGIMLEQRPFTPHITLARCKQVNPQQVAALLLKQQPELPEVAVDAFLLFQSSLSARGAEHRVLRRFATPPQSPWPTAG
ncbi:RNA 2',3'-cyclic phosphodiesterase [Trichlorobacter lovleyi]|uniref:RNA 2',3'-cyclic phosphodiesterase n=1 Tax=Trichlorobacter lovleyi TaxID=313985 RepID=UPI002240E056|nr:RNA 2',3'-cyclic phosphodiesterase [Trichlorobacter lovleyi]QOX77552.1 RNA 2',3'-cyclic phosphodiesterase [Trichlorobacter lovleyi]